VNVVVGSGCVGRGTFWVTVGGEELFQCCFALVGAERRLGKVGGLRGIIGGSISFDLFFFANVGVQKL